MKKIALHIDEKGKLVLLKYKNIDEFDKAVILKGNECIHYIETLSRDKIVDVYEPPNGKDVTLEYDKYILEIYDYMKLFRKKEMSPILDNIRIYNEKVELTNRKRKKVTRKNKYTKARITAIGLAFLIMLGCAMGWLHKSSKKEEIVTNLSIGDNMDDDFAEDLALNIDTSKVIVLKNEIKEEPILEDEIPTVSIDYEDRSNTEKAHITKAYYSELINKYSKIYGLDPKLVTAIATQERGVHSGKMDAGGATGLMQVQNAVWAGENLSAYNFETNTRENIVVNEKSLSNVDYSIKVGCMILQTVFKYMDYNTLAAVQCYNMGYGNMKKILNAYSAETGKSIDEILNDVTDVDWMNYRYLIKMGDQEYVENVFSWLGNDFKISNKRADGTDVCFNVKSLENIKSIH